MGKDNFMSYEHFNRMGLCRPYSVRIPAHVLAQLDLLMKFGPWSSKADMFYNILQSVLLDFLDSASDQVREEFRQVMEKAIQQPSEPESENKQ